MHGRVNVLISLTSFPRKIQKSRLLSQEYGFTVVISTVCTLLSLCFTRFLCFASIGSVPVALSGLSLYMQTPNPTKARRPPIDARAAIHAGTRCSLGLSWFLIKRKRNM